jgi:hypothetical protein
MLTFVFSQLSNKQTSTNTRAAQPSLKNTLNNSDKFDLTADLKITFELYKNRSYSPVGDAYSLDPIVLSSNDTYYFRIKVNPKNQIKKKIPIFCSFEDNVQPYIIGNTTIRPTFYVDSTEKSSYLVDTEIPYNASSSSKGTHVMTITCDGVNFGEQISFLPSKSRSFIFSIK